MPLSCSSCPTTQALIWQLRRTAMRKASASRARNFSMFCSSHSKKAMSAIGPYLITSARPALSSRSGSVAKVSMSHTTRRGW